MPQPLSKVNSVCNLDLTRGPWDSPEIATRVAEIFGQWAKIDQQLNLLVVRILGANAMPALAMFDTITSDAIARTMRLAAAKATFSEEEFILFRAVTVIAEAAYAQRNKFAHWIWAQTDALPDVLLLADPTYLIQKDRVWAKALETGTGEISQEDVTLDRNHILVYTIPDLDRTVRDLREAHEAVSTYAMALWLQKYPEMRDPIHQRLLGLHPVRMALARLRESQNNAPQPQP